MRKAIDGDSNWNDLESLLNGTNAFVLIKEDVGGAVKAIQSFQKDTKNPKPKELYLKVDFSAILKSKKLQVFLLKRY